jgi:hypothetical protein
MLLLGCAGNEPLGGPPADPGDDDPPAGGSGGSGGRGGAGGAGGRAGAGGAGGSNGSAGSGGASGGTGGSAPSPDAGAATPDSAPPAAADAGAPISANPMLQPYGCTNCKPIFNGMNLDGWATKGGWEVREGGILASTGQANDIWTTKTFGTYRLFFQVKQEKGDHKPDVLFFGVTPTSAASAPRALRAAQFQPPNGGSWDYGAGGKFTRITNPGWDAKAGWFQCEVIVKEEGSFKAACCPMMGETLCKGVHVLNWQGTGRKHPFGIQMHNPGLVDLYRNIVVDEAPTSDELISIK